ncbi:MAG: hypothetical protein ACP5T5_05880, partial [Thermoprotei archaeon]
IRSLTGNESGAEASQKLRDISSATGVPIEEAFSSVYESLIGRKSGPRLSSLIDVLGLKRIIEDLRD